MSIIPLVLFRLALCIPSEVPRLKRPCLPGLTMPGVQRYFYGSAGQYLQGRNYRSLTGTSTLRCVNECQRDERCFSINYLVGTTTCELNAAAATCAPQDINEMSDVYYYGPEKAEAVEKLRSLAEGDKGQLGLTNCTYDTQALASTECQSNGQHLCELWEVDKACADSCYGILPADTSLWYAVPDSQAVVSLGGVTQHGLPMISPSPAVCCPGPRRDPQDPIITASKYTREDLAGQARACSDLAAHPCMLPELKAASRRGYQDPLYGWPFFAIPNRDIWVPPHGCGEGYTGPLCITDTCGGKYVGPECYEGTVVNTPRTSQESNVICCLNLY